MIVFAQGTYDERIPQTQECIRRVKGWVDRMVIVVDDTVSEASKELLRSEGCEVYFHPWNDDFPRMRNNYLSHCQADDWIIVSDPDEWFDGIFLHDLKPKIIPWAEKEGYNLLLVNVHDTMYKLDGTEDSSIPEWFKFLCFKNIEGTHYVGTGQAQNLHENLVIPGKKAVNLPREYFYQHVKHEIEVLERSFRNVWIAGGGADRGTQNPDWSKLRAITERLGLKAWRDVRLYLRAGGIDDEFRELIASWSTKAGWDFEEEEFQAYRYYKARYPNEMPDASERRLSHGSPAEVEQYVTKTYLTTLGRYPDNSGKEFYMLQILNGRLKRETLPLGLLMAESRVDELVEKKEQATVRIVLDATVVVNENMMKTLAISGDIWNRVKPNIDLGKALEETLSNPKEFYQWFYRDKQTITREKLLSRLRGGVDK